MGKLKIIANLTAAIKKLVLHVGLPKTGTSAFQAWLHENTETLATRSISVPVDNNIYGPKYVALVNGLRSGNLDSFSALIESTKNNTIIISNEGLSNHFYDFPNSSLAEFKTITSKIEIFTIFVTRNREDWLQSYYKQCVINPPNGSSELWATTLGFDSFRDHHRVRQLADFTTLAEDIKHGYGSSEQINPSIEQGGWFERILETLGFEQNHGLKLRQFNEALPEWVIAFVREINGLGLTYNERMRWIAELQRYLNTSNVLFVSTAANYGRENPYLLGSSVIERAQFGLEAGEFRQFSDEIARFRAFLTDQKLLQ